VYTFTLREDVFWSDGAPVTALDVKYSLLRALDPATGSPMSYVLYSINNALEYNEGTISDPNLVGISAPSLTSLVITLEWPGAYLPAILSTQVSKPVPQHVVQTYGSAWSEPQNIVTNGAYRLTEWISEDHLLLDKNPTYFDSATVKIEQVKVHIINDATVAWNAYLNDELHTIEVPIDAIIDPAHQPEIRKEIAGCTNYYGFTNNKPPFDDHRVRKAFAMSIDKRDLVQTVTLGAQTPTGQFGLPGLWGAPELGTVGYIYSPTSAKAYLQSYLDENNMTLADFNNLDISLMHNTSDGHSAIASAAQEDWYNTLGISVTVTDMEWYDYLALLNPSTPLDDMPHIWRLVWCMDYADEHNFISIFHNVSGYNNNRLRRGCSDPNCYDVTPQVFESLIDQAAKELDQTARRELYLNAEKELTEVETGYMPLYHYGIFVASKPYLMRTYPVSDAYDISEWWFDYAETAITTEGGNLASPDGTTLIEIPSSVFTDTVTLTYAAANDQPPPQFDFVNSSGSFDITAVYSDTGQTASLLPGETYTLTVELDTSTIGPIIENTLQQHYWNGEYWSPETTSEILIDGETITVQSTPNHFSLWAVFGETNRVMLPLITR